MTVVELIAKLEVLPAEFQVAIYAMGSDGDLTVVTNVDVHHPDEYSTESTSVVVIE